MASADDQRRKTEPHLVNINEDLLLSGVVFHFIPCGTTTIGRKEAKPAPDIAFNGLRLGGVGGHWVGSWLGGHVLCN